MDDDSNLNADQKLRIIETERWWDVYTGAATFTKEYGISTVRSLFLINGGAAVALLAALSHILTEDTELAKKIAGDLNWSFGFFLLGLGCAVLTGAMGYFNFFYLGAGLPGPNELHRYLKTGDVSGWRPKSAVVSSTLYAAIVFATCSLIGFASGAFYALKAFGKL